MIVAGVLVAYAVLLAVAGPPVMRARGWADGAPRPAIAGWVLLAASILTAWLLAGLALVVPASAWSLDLAELLDACVMMLRAAYAAPGSAMVVTAGLAATLLIGTRLAYGVGVELLAARLERRRHARVLDMVARRDADLGALVIDHCEPAAYCLPGRGGRVVLTTSTLASLDDRQVAAVVAHERAHLRQRHHLLIALTRGIARAVPFVPAFRAARDEVARLTELAADDAATRASGRLTVAEALFTLASGGPAPAAAMAATGSHTAQRIRRLLAQPKAVCGTRRLLTGAFAVIALMVPLAVAAAPALTAVGTACCR